MKTLPEEVIYTKNLVSGIFLKVNILLGIAFAAINEIAKGIIDKYLVADWEFVSYLFVLVLINTGLAWWIQWRTKPWSLPKGERLLIKTILYLIFVWAIGLVNNFTIHGIHPPILDWIDDTVFSALMFREFASLVKKSMILLPGIWPQYLVDKILKADESGILENK